MEKAQSSLDEYYPTSFQKIKENTQQWKKMEGKLPKDIEGDNILNDLRSFKRTFYSLKNFFVV